MSSLARKPARGNWIWLGGALCASAVFAAGVIALTLLGTQGARRPPAAEKPRLGTEATRFSRPPDR